jgi:hypothetical protein
MHLFLLTVYSSRPWHKKIEHNEYILESSGLTKEVQSQNLRPGETVYMTMLIKHKGVMSDTSCRECRAINVEKICGDKKTRWSALRARICPRTSQANICCSLSCGLVSSVTESTLETGNVDPVSKKENDSQAKPLKTSRDLVEERFLRIRYDCDLSTQKLGSTQTLSSTPQSNGLYAPRLWRDDMWDCYECGSINTSWDAYCLLCGHDRA